MRYLVTGGAGFIGSHLVDALLARGDEVVALDNFNSYYDPARKRRNVRGALGRPGYTLVEANFCDAEALERVFAQHRPQRVAHLGGMAGVRASVAQPHLYERVNVGGSLAMLEAARRHEVGSFVLASTSSVYGRSPTPWREDLPADRPLSPYAATKRAAELLAFTSHSLYGTPTTVVRFFTVYGPRGRPDMTPSLFVERMAKGEPFTLFNGGDDLFRDYTYVSDIVDGVVAALDTPRPYEVINLGNSQPVLMRRFVELLGEITGLPVRADNVPLPPTEPLITFADTTKARTLLEWEPTTRVEQGLERFWAWYRDEILGAKG
jgi:UDP-glucuronate 4-epimerase